MPHAEPYFPGSVFSVEDGDTPSVPRVLIAPGRYVQGPGVFAHLGRYLGPLEVKRPAVLASEGGTEVVARAPLRYLVSGMGDGLATWYEARACFRNPSARTAVFARPTVASMTLGEACASTIREFGPGAIAAVQARRVDEALERVVEANTLLSGIGFESSGVAAAHAIATGAFPAFPAVHASCLHGEMVAVGLLAQLVLEGELEEAADVAGFLASVGLPVHLGQIGLDPDRDADSIRAVAEMAAVAPFMDNEPLAVTAEGVHAALLGAHDLGLEAAAREGDAAYRALHPEPAAA